MPSASRDHTSDRLPGDPGGAQDRTPDPARRGGRPGVTAARLSKHFSQGGTRVTALDDVDLDIRQGEFVVVVGPSGCGKTTLLRILAGLEEPTSGAIDFAIDHGAKPLRAMVFQEHGVFPWMTVLDNVSYGLTARGVARPEREATARHYIDMLGLSAFERAYPAQLSGGMRQRVSVARAFAVDPALLLMDEPFASVDELTRLAAHEDLLRIWGEAQKTVVFITHSLDEAVVLADRVVVMTRRPGRVKDIIDIDLPRPRDVRDLPGTPEFVALRQRVWTSLRDEIAESRA